MFTLRKVITYQVGQPSPKNGFKCIVLDGVRYIVTIKNNEIQTICEAKTKPGKKDNLKVTPNKETFSLYSKLSNLFFNVAKVNLPDEYCLEIIVSNKGVLITDILYSSNENLENVKYLNRIEKIKSLVQSHSSKLRVIKTDPVHHIETNLISTPTLLRCLCSVLTFGSDYIINPTEKTFTYAIVGVAYMKKNDFVIKREPYIKLTNINNNIKLQLIGSDDQSLLSTLSELTEDKQLEFYNTQKNQLFDKVAEDVNTITLPNNQSQKVFLVAGVNKNKLSIFGYTNDGKKLLDENIFINQPQNVTWEKPEFEKVFNNIKYYNKFYHIVSRQSNKFNPNKLRVISILSSTALSPNTITSYDIFDNVPLNEHPNNIHKTLNNATNNEIITECISRIGNTLLQSETVALRNIFQNLKNFNELDATINEKFNDILCLLNTNETEIIRTILKPLQNEILDANHLTLNKINTTINQLQRKRQHSIQQTLRKKMRFNDNSVICSDEENE